MMRIMVLMTIGIETGRRRRRRQRRLLVETLGPLQSRFGLFARPDRTKVNYLAPFQDPSETTGARTTATAGVLLWLLLLLVLLLIRGGIADRGEH
jgi:hypothetical protein